MYIYHWKSKGEGLPGDFWVCWLALEFQGQKKYIRLCPSKRDYTCLVYIPSYTPTSHCTCNAHQVSAKSHRKNVAIQVPGNLLCISSVWIACDPALEVQRQYNNSYIWSFQFCFECWWWNVYIYPWKSKGGGTAKRFPILLGFAHGPWNSKGKQNRSDLPLKNKL